MNKIKSIMAIGMIVILFMLMVFGLYKALLDKEYLLSLGLLVIIFAFSYLMLKTPKIKNWNIGGDHAKFSVNEDNEDEPKD